MAAIDNADILARDRRADQRTGLMAGLAANTMWGFLPILFAFVEVVDPISVIANRTVWSLVVVGGFMLLAGRLGEIRAVFKEPGTILRLLVSALLLAINWLIYVWAVENNYVLEGSFGYFINPMVNVVTGMVLLGERQNKWQTVALVIALVAIAIQAVGIGGVPFISLGLAVSFGLYGYFRKTVKANSATGLFVETVLLLPLAVGFIVWTIVAQGVGHYTDPRLFTLLVLTGPATAVPLLMFAYAVQRLRLTTMGMLQYLAPSIQFVLAITYFHEHLNGTRLFSFALIWVSLAVFSWDSWRRQGAAATA